MLHPIRRRTTSDSIAEQIQESIHVGSLKVGDRLPSERALSEQLGVGRLSVREAVRLLIARNVVEIRPGDGTFVKRMSSDDLAEPIRHFLVLNRQAVPDLVEARLVIEIECAGLATERLTAADEAQLIAVLETMERHYLAHDWEQYVEADARFHLLLCQASRNTILLEFIKALLGMVVETARRKGDLHEATRRALEGHRKILAAVRARDIAAARAAMREHLEIVRWELQEHGSGQ